MKNPFKLYWAEEWTFQIVHMYGGIHLEAHGLGICLRSTLLPSDNILIAADNLIFKEDRKRKALKNHWKRINNSHIN